MPRALIIDDDNVTRAYVRTVLSSDGYEVEEAGDGRTGALAFPKNPADVVLCDIHMPEQDGLETICEITREYIGARIVAISTSFTETLNYGGLAMKLGAVSTLAKPFTPDELLGAVRDAVKY